jgi:hypothetical protein
MRRKRVPIKMVRQISADPKPAGVKAVYLVETQNEREAADVQKVFEEFEPHIEIRQLTRGRLVSYAVQLHSDDQSLLDEIDAVLKGNFGFVVMQRSFDDLIYRVVTELCRDTESKLLPIPECHICGRSDPFPDMVVNLASEEGELVLSRNYCGTCTAGTMAKSNKQFVLSLLSADKTDFGELSHAELVRLRAGKEPIRFKVKHYDEPCAVAG